MKVKVRNLIEVIMQGLAILLLFLPGMFYENIWRRDLYYWTKTPWGDGYVSFVSKMGQAGGFFGVLALIAVVVGLILFIVQLVSNGEKSNLKIAIVPPCLQLVFVLVSSLFLEQSHTTYESYYGYELSFLFFIEMALLIAIALIAVIGYFKASKEGIIDASAPAGFAAAPANQNVITEEQRILSQQLIENKKMLDAGMITPEEYEARKKQLLNLR